MDNKYEVCLVNIKKYKNTVGYLSYVMFVNGISKCLSCFCTEDKEDELSCCNCIFRDYKEYTKEELQSDDRIINDNCMAIYDVGIDEFIVVACGKGKRLITCSDVLCCHTKCDSCKLKSTNTSELKKLN